jgi:hypothetical protein
VDSIQRARVWVVVGALGALGILALGWFFAVSPMLDVGTSIRSQSSTIDAQNLAVQARITQLKAAEENRDELDVELAQTRAEFPVRAGTGVFGETLQRTAERDLVTVNLYTVGNPTLVTTDAAAASTPAADGARQTFAIPVTITVAGPATNVDTFIIDLQGPSQRAFIITNSVIVPLGDDATVATDVSATLTGTIWVSPLDPEGAAALFAEGEVG